jgi:hypothetical protein
MSTSRISANKRSTDFLSVKSAANPVTAADGFSSLICLMAFSTLALVHPLIITVAPSCANNVAMAKPIPDVEPVTNAFLFLSR